LTIPAGGFLTISLFGAFRVLYGLYEEGTQGAALVFATTMIVLTTLPFLQLISWQIEYALQTLKGTVYQSVLPHCFLKLVSTTNVMLPLFVKPLDWIFGNGMFPAGWNQSGHAVVQSIVDTNTHAISPNDEKTTTKTLTPEGLEGISSGLMVQVLRGSLATTTIIAMWAVLTNFGLFPVNARFSRCAFSKDILNLLHTSD
jgi:hypothetical protein